MIIPRTRRILLFIAIIAVMIYFPICIRILFKTSSSHIIPSKHAFSLEKPIHHDEDTKYIVISVLSSAGYHARRMNVRQTWGRKTHIEKSTPKGIKIIGPQFIIGKCEDHDLSCKSEVMSEQWKFNDLIQLDVIEDYRDLIGKMNATFRYLDAVYTGNEKLTFFKMDDDTYINLEKVLTELKPTIAHNDPRFYCHINRGIIPVRKPEHKWYVSREDFPHDVYPNYCPGALYMFNQKMLSHIIERSKQIKAMPMEDVYYSGIIGGSVNATFVEMGYVNSWVTLREPGTGNLSFLCENEYSVVHHLSVKEMRPLHECLYPDTI